MQSEDAVRIGPYEGELAPRYRSPETLEVLSDLRARLQSPPARLVAGGGRNRHVCIDLPLPGGSQTVIVKAFGRLSAFHQMRDRRRGSKARRSWLYARHLARHGVGTPSPVGYLERWEQGRLEESYFLAVYSPNARHFRHALGELFRERPEAALFIELLECVAAGIRAMHDAGYVHNDLGHQNILLDPLGEGRWDGFQVIDLNRGRLRGELTVRERARDFARLDLQSQLLRILMKMYWRKSPPRDFLRWERWYRFLRRLHIASRGWRHPMRERRRRRARATGGAPSTPRDAWIWDERSAQPVAVHTREDRLRLYPAQRYIRTIADSVRAAPAVWRHYRQAQAESFRDPVDFAGRIGMSVNPTTPETLARELALLAELGRLPVMLRFYHHEPAERTRFRLEAARALRGAGHPLSISLVQDRKAVLDAASWQRFCGEVLDATAALVETVEVGHNINRAKWGVWDLDEVRALYAPLAALRARHPGVHFTGLAAIDFEYTFLCAALREWPADVPLFQLSHHLYVDRRGAPENPQFGFDAADKATLLRAVARHAGVDRVTVTEVNWPIKGTGLYSPVAAPYVLRADGGAGVTEERYADYLVRYLCLLLGSGHVERIYWWRLAARGFGLVDDADGPAWRRRPAFEALRRFLDLVGESTLVAAHRPAASKLRHGRYRFLFRRPDGEEVELTYAHGAELPFPVPDGASRIEDLYGQVVDRARLDGRPVYLRA